MNVKVVVDFAKLGAIVKAKRLELDWSTSRLANISGVSATRINQLENNSPTEYTGKIRRPKEETLTKIARALRLPEDELLSLAGYNVQKNPVDVVNVATEGSAESKEASTLYRTEDPEQQTLIKMEMFQRMGSNFEELTLEEQQEYARLIVPIAENLERRAMRRKK